MSKKYPTHELIRDEINHFLSLPSKVYEDLELVIVDDENNEYPIEKVSIIETQKKTRQQSMKRKLQLKITMDGETE